MHKQVPIVQPTAAFRGFPNHPENLLQPNEGILPSLAFAEPVLKLVFFFLLQKCRNKEKTAAKCVSTMAITVLVQL